MASVNWITGVGLNLTRANNVINLDLAWSQAVEAQAYDR
jgi:SNF2 family DNA or RNA helicase